MDQNKSKEIITPLSSLKNLVDCLDKALASLDEAADHFEIAVLGDDVLDPEMFAKLTEKERTDILSLMENYTLMCNFLIDHPLTTVIKQIRAESKIADTDPCLQAMRVDVKVGDVFQHYKGTIYSVSGVARNSNSPQVVSIHYFNEFDGTQTHWQLPIHEFFKLVEVDGNMVPRFRKQNPDGSF